jgi:hypothetical protein
VDKELRGGGGRGSAGGHVEARREGGAAAVGQRMPTPVVQATGFQWRQTVPRRKTGEAGTPIGGPHYNVVRRGPLTCGPWPQRGAAGAEGSGG